MRKLTSLLYKDLYLNRFTYIAILACGIVFENLSLIMTFFGNASDGIDMRENGAIISVFDLLGMLVAFFFMQSLTKALLSSDENKAWASFIISTPATSKYQVIAHNLQRTDFLEAHHHNEGQLHIEHTAKIDSQYIKCSVG